MVQPVFFVPQEKIVELEHRVHGGPEIQRTGQMALPFPVEGVERVEGKTKISTELVGVEDCSQMPELDEHGVLNMLIAGPLVVIDRN